jgi:hypothetical protein
MLYKQLDLKCELCSVCMHALCKMYYVHIIC